MRNTKKMFESRLSAGATVIFLGCEKPRAKTVAWSYDKEGHAKKSASKDIANWPVKRLSKCTKSHIT